MKRTFLAIFTLSALFGTQTFAKGVSCLPDGYPHVYITPGWDCKKASTATEKAICEQQGPPHYPAVKDHLVGQIYKNLKSANRLTPEIISGFRFQQKFRDDCGGDVSCISKRRGRQIEILLDMELNEADYENWYCNYIEKNNLMPTADEIASSKPRVGLDFRKAVKEEEARKAREAKAEAEKLAKQKAEEERLKQNFEAMRQELMANSFGYRNLRPYMTKDEVAAEAGCSFSYFPIATCYDLDNIKFGGRWGKLPGYEQFDAVLRELIIDLGPLDTYSWVSALSNWTAADPENRNIYQNMRSILGAKYKLDFEFSERDITFFDDADAGQLRVSYENGQVTLEVQKKKVNYSTEVNLVLSYNAPDVGLKYVDFWKPKKAQASDF